MSRTLFFFQSKNFRTFLSVTSSYMLEPGFRMWLPGILWHYNLHQTKLVKDFAPKESNLVFDLLLPSLTFYKLYVKDAPAFSNLL